MHLLEDMHSMIAALTPSPMQLMGFTMMTLFLLFLAIFYNYLRDNSNWGFIVMCEWQQMWRISAENLSPCVFCALRPLCSL